jgi:uncharacterized membrane protein
LYDLLLTLHVLGAIVWLGGSVMLLVLGYAHKGAGIERRTDFTRTAEKISSILFAAASILVVLAGSFLVDEAGYGYSDTWVILGYAGWFISFLLGVGFYGAEGKRRERAIEEGGIDSPAVAKSIDRVLTVATVDTLIIALVVIDMTTKPFV